MAGALLYTLEVDAADGTVRFSAATTDTVLSAALDSVAPGEQRWWIIAQMDDGSQRRSTMRPLRLR